MVNGANVRRFLSRNVGIWRETEESTIEKLEKPLQSWIVSHRFCKCGRKAESASRAKPITSLCKKWSRSVRQLAFRSTLRPSFGRDVAGIFPPSTPRIYKKRVLRTVLFGQVNRTTTAFPQKPP